MGIADALRARGATMNQVADLIEQYAYPGWTTWVPTLGGFSVNPTSAVYRYMIQAKKCTVCVTHGANGTSNGTSFTISAPIASANITNAMWTTACAFAVNNGGIINTAIARILPNTSTIDLFIDSSFAAWNNANGKRAIFTLDYEIA